MPSFISVQSTIYILTMAICDNLTVKSKKMIC